MCVCVCVLLHDNGCSMPRSEGNKRHCNYRIIIMKGVVSCCWDIMWLYRTELILSFYLNFTANMFADTSPEDETVVSKRVIPILLDFKLSPCPVCNMFSFG